MSEKIELYQPSNGTEGEFFMSKFCFQCVKWPHSCDAKNQCNIAMRTMAYNIGDKEYPKEWRYDESGNPTCTAFKSRAEYNAERRSKRTRHSSPPADKHTQDLFAPTT